MLIIAYLLISVKMVFGATPIKPFSIDDATVDKKYNNMLDKNKLKFCCNATSLFEVGDEVVIMTYSDKKYDTLAFFRPDNGKLKIIQELVGVGYITDMVAVDIDNDNRNELIISVTDNTNNYLFIAKGDTLKKSFALTKLNVEHDIQHISASKAENGAYVNILGSYIINRGEDFDSEDGIVAYKLNGNSLVKVNEERKHYFVSDIIAGNYHGNKAFIVAEKIGPSDSLTSSSLRIYNAYNDKFFPSLATVPLNIPFEMNYPLLCGGEKEPYFYLASDLKIMKFDEDGKFISNILEIRGDETMIKKVFYGRIMGKNSFIMLTSGLDKNLKKYKNGLLYATDEELK